MSAAGEDEEREAQPALTDTGLDLGTASVHWPQVTGMADEAMQALVNERLAEAAGAAALVGRMALVMESGMPLTASWRGAVRGNVLSCVMYAEGPIESERFRSVWHSVNLDLETGEAFTLAELFGDPEETPEICEDALAAIADILEWEIAPGLSAHLMNNELTPLPDDFLIGDAGLTLFYPVRRLSTLSDRAGAVTLSWSELGLPFRDDPDGIPARFGLIRAQSPDREAFLAAFAGGVLPGVPAALGNSVEDLVSAYRLDGEPDLYDGGRYVQLEDSRFRGVLLMTDDRSPNIRQFPGSSVLGIRADRFSLHGVAVNATDSTRDDVLLMLGEPYASIALDREAADAMRLVPGVSDYYQADGCRLRLHYDEDGFLRSIFVLQ